MKKTIFIMIISFAGKSCQTINSHAYRNYSQKDLAGSYLQVDNKSYKLLLGQDSSFLFSIPNGYYGPEWGAPDTISYGKWEIEPNGMIAISSPAYLSKRLRIKVSESENAFQDTIYIKINNPIEKDLARNKNQSRDIQYLVEALTKESTYLEQVNPSTLSSLVKLYNPKKMHIVALNITICSKPDYAGALPPYDLNEGIRVKETENYYPTSTRINKLEINIPDLTYSYIYTRRLNRDFVKVIDNNKLEWDDHIFAKVK